METEHMDHVEECKKQSRNMEWSQAHGAKNIFIVKAVCDVLLIPVNLYDWELITSDRCRAYGEITSRKHILTGRE